MATAGAAHFRAALAALLVCLLVAGSAFAQSADPCGSIGLYNCVLNNSCTKSGQECCALVNQVYCGADVAGNDIGCAPYTNYCPCLQQGQVYCPDTGSCAPTTEDCVPVNDPCAEQGMITCQETTVCSPSQEVCDSCLNQGLKPCPTGTCAASIEQCSVPTTWKCEDFRWVTCNSTDARRMCAPSTELCFAETVGCENHGWMTCVDKCVPEAKFCIQSTCELQGLVTCPRSGKCVRFPEQCDNACDTVVCPDGRCVLSDQECQYSPCPDEIPTRCDNGECINSKVDVCCTEGTVRCPFDNSTCRRIEDCISPCDYTTHMRCPDGTCVEKANGNLCDYKCSLPGYKHCSSGVCIPEQEVCPCPDGGQVWCPLQNSCVDAASTTAWACKPCPVGASRCPESGHCVQDLAFCGSNNVPVCPPGQALCSKTLRCVDDLRFCTTDTCPYICPSTTGDAFCVNDPAECCSSTRPFFCTATLSCLASISECPGMQICKDPTPFKCWDGTCVTNRSACGCPPDLFKCEKTSQCVKRAEECSIIDDNICTSGIRCKDGTCKRFLTECGSTLVCPAPLLMCADGATCARDVTACPSVPTCDTSRPYFCASSGTCTIGPDYCPSSVNCGPNSFFCFFSKKCVSSPSECTDSTGVACPTVAPFLCRDGSCRKSSRDCPTDPVCPTERPILCSSPRICVADVAQCFNHPKENCEAQNLTTCNDGQSCARSLSLCPSPSQCPPNYVLCDSGVCAPHVNRCPPRKNCTDLGLVACNDGTCVKDSVSNCPTRPTCPATAPVLCQGSGKCAPSVDKCPPPRQCPKERPFTCPNRQCVRQKEECSNDVVCPSGFVRCPYSSNCKPTLTDCNILAGTNNETNDQAVICPVTGELKPSYDMCPRPPVCNTKERPVLCWDLSCRASVDECPKPFKENEIVDPTERCVLPMIRCADGHCRHASDCPQTETSCPNNIPVKCEDGTCRRAIADCPPTKTICSTDQILCWDRRTCVDRMKPYECPQMTTCPDPKSVLCWDRTCRPSLEQCPKAPPKSCNTTAREQLCWNQECAVQCPPHPTRCNNTHPVLCPDHSCQSTKENCVVVSSSPCPFDYVFCPRDGRCYAAADSVKCEQSKPDCPSGFVLCANGKCIREQVKCSTTDSECPDVTPVRCATTHKCIDPTKEKCPSASFCPARLPYRCPRGLCVASAKDCPEIDPNEAAACIKLGLGKIVCSNGRCVNDSRECEAVWPCDPAWARCADGTCRPNTDDCPISNTCPSTLPYRCADGSCAVSETRCRNPSGCFGTQIRCPNGLCVFNSSDCTRPSDQDAPLSNGCTSRKPIRCAFTGECVTVESYCMNAQQCPSWAPFRCAATRACVKDALECSSSVPTNCTEFTCPINGECVSDLRICKNQFGCPLSTPIRCSTGECVPSSNDCPRLVRCTNDKPFLCADMTCVAELSQCRSIKPCPDNAPVRCNDGRTCQATLDDCTSKCPESRPVLCPDGKTCVDSPASCGKDANERCRAENPKFPFFCEATGFCVPSPYDCVSKLPPCESTNGQQQLVRCPSGICAPAERCPPLPPCSKETPFRCRDGSCAADASQCQDKQVPTRACDNLTHQRCADGMCRDQCTPIDGCKPGQIRCPDRRCHDVPTTSASTYAEICRGSCAVDKVELFDGDCVNVTAPIPDERNPKTFRYTLPKDGSTSEILFSDEDDDSINIGIFDLPNNTDSSVFVRPVHNVSQLVDAVRKAIAEGLILQHCSELTGVEISLLDANDMPVENSLLEGQAEIRLTTSSRCDSKPNSDICLAYLARNETTGNYEVRIEDCMGQKGYVATRHFTPFFAVAAPVENNPSATSSNGQHSDDNNNVSAASHLHGSVVVLLFSLLLLAMAF